MRNIIPLAVPSLLVSVALLFIHLAPHRKKPSPALPAALEPYREEYESRASDLIAAMQEGRRIRESLLLMPAAAETTVRLRQVDEAIRRLEAEHDLLTEEWEQLQKIQSQ